MLGDCKRVIIETKKGNGDYRG